jgi:acetyl-CoA synthetase
MKFEELAAGFASGTSSAAGTSPSSPAGTQPSDTQAVVHHLSELLARASVSPASRNFVPEATLLDDPALIIYTSGTTGPPKGALHAHRVLLGHLPGVEFPQGTSDAELIQPCSSSSVQKGNAGRCSMRLTHSLVCALSFLLLCFNPLSAEFFPQRDDLFWTPADWAWIGGLIDVLLPSLHHGVPVLACRFRKFEAEAAFACIERRGVKNMFMPPTALKLMRGVSDAAARYPNMRVRSIGSGGESLGEALLDWGRSTFKGVTINEFYGQTESNLVLGNCSTLFPPRAGSMGRAIPGHVVDVVDEATGTPLPDGEVGCIGVRAPHPVMMLLYWNKPEATAAKYAGGYLLTGDLATRDEEGFFTFFGRADDVIKSAGYRIGPAEIEECMMKHPDVQNVAVVGVPDDMRGERVKAYVVLRPDSIAKSVQNNTRFLLPDK